MTGDWWFATGCWWEVQLRKRSARATAPPTPPIILDEYQKKRLRKFAIRKPLILKGTFLVVRDKNAQNLLLQKKKNGSRAPAGKLDFSLSCIVPNG